MSMEKRTTEALRWMVGIFNKHQIPYQISGGFAARVYGSKRPLNDIDFDISERFFHLIVPEISKHIVYGPARFKNEKWDCDLITLNYHGQEIDISGADTIRIHNKERTKWLSFGDAPLNALDMRVDGIDVSVMHPRDLIEYKKELDGEHQLIDIKAAEEYIASQGL